MFKATMSDSKLLRSSIDAISNLIDEAGISADNEGLKLRAMDPAHVALVDFQLGKEAFDNFEVTEPLVLGVDLERLNTILKRAGSGEMIGLDLDEDKNMLKIKIKNTSTRTFSLPLIDVSEEELKVPSLDFPSSVEILPNIIKEAIKDAEIVSDHVTLKTDENNLYISAKGDLGNVGVKILKDDVIEFLSSGEVSSMFSLEYLTDMMKASDLADTVKINLGNDVPVRLDFKAENVQLLFLLAPRIESE
ncbi:MAG: proliferating cell nuclear antigen (pcna) [Candidatus Hydrothermarchaeales archaeon]